MGLFKNLYFDFGSLNPFRNRKSGKEDTMPAMSEPASALAMSADDSTVFNFNSPPTPEQFRDLPSVSRRLLEPQSAEKEGMKFELPKVERKHVEAPPKIEQIEKAQEAPGEPEESEALDISEEPEPAEEIMSNVPDSNTDLIEDAGEELAPPPHEINNDSFFSNLFNHMSTEETYIHSNLPKDVMQKNLFGEMQQFWKDKKNDIHNAAMSKAVKQDLMKKIEELQEQEIEWQRLQLQHERLKDQLASKEILIDNNIRQLKKAFKRTHFNLYIPPEHYFKLSNGSRIRNLQELVDALRTMDAEVFSSHVSDGRNDFANWINDVMGLQDLAQNIKTAKTKAQMSDFIENWYSIV